MEEKYCPNCMRPIRGGICPHCGCRADQPNPGDLLAVGTVIAGRFRVGLLRERLWDGASYMGLDQESGETVHIREYFPQGSRRENGRVVPADAMAFARGEGQFASRSTALTRIDSLKQICAAVAAVNDLGTSFLVTSAFKSVTLSRYLGMRPEGLGEAETFRLLEPVLQALTALHNAGFAHGSIGPETVLLDPMGGAKLTGVAATPGADPAQDVCDLARLMKTCMGPAAQAALSGNRAEALRLAEDPARRISTAGVFAAALRGGAAAVPPAPVQPQPPAAPANPKKSRLPLIIAGAVLAVALIVCFFTVHIWVDATCSRPKHCALCGKTQGRALPHEFEPATCEDPEICEVCGDTGEEALGHAWVEANCVAPRTCSVCGRTEGTAGGHVWTDADCVTPKTCGICNATEGAALGHDWKEATYEAPKTCRRCGATEGSIRGYYAEVPSHSIRFHTNTVSGWAQEFDSYYTDVYRFTIHVEITDVSYGSAEGRWEAFYRTASGAWVSLGYFELTGDEASVTFTLEDPTDVTAVAAVIAKGGNFSFSKRCYVTDLYCYD